MNRFTLNLLLAASLAVNAGVVAALLVGAAEPRGDAGDPNCLLERLDLTDAERAAASAARGDFPAWRADHVARVAALRHDLADAVAAPEGDRDRVHPLLARIAAAQEGFQRRVIDRVLDVRAALGPARRAQYDALLLPRIRSGGILRCD